MLQDRRQEKTAQGSRPRILHHLRAQPLTRSLSVLQHAPASSGKSSSPVEKRRPLGCFQPLPGEGTGVRGEGKFPGWKPFLFPSKCDSECARSPLAFILLNRQIAQWLIKPRTRARPERPPARRLPSRPASRSDECVRGRVCDGECVSGRVSVHEPRTPSVARPADAAAWARPGRPL